MWTLRILNEDGTTRDETFQTPEDRRTAAMEYRRQGVSTLGIEPDPIQTKYDEDDLFGRMGD